MDSLLSNRIRIMSSFCALLALIACLHAVARAQQNVFVPSPLAPPPMKFIPSGERTQLSTARDAKARLKASLSLAELRLARAEQFTVDQRFIAACSELGVYQAIIEDTMHYMSQQKSDTNKTRDLYKNLEIELRKHSNRIESMRRVTPKEYAVHLKCISDFAEDARTNALDAFFSGAVLVQDSEDKKAAAKVNPPVSPPVQTKNQP